MRKIQDFTPETASKWVAEKLRNILKFIDNAAPALLVMQGDSRQPLTTQSS